MMKPVHSPVIPECETCPNRRNFDICQLVPPVEEFFGLIKRRVMYQPGQYVFYEGHAALGLYILCQGRVKLTKVTRRGQQRLVDILVSGQLLEKQVFQEQSIHQVTSETLEPSQICLLDRTSFLAFLKDHGEKAVQLIQVLSREITAVVAASDEFAFTPARERLARLLLELSDRFGKQEDAGLRITLNLKREDLAQMVAVTVETVVRLLHDFQKNRFILVHGRELTLVNTDRLTALAGMSHSR